MLSCACTGSTHGETPEMNACLHITQTPQPPYHLLFVCSQSIRYCVQETWYAPAPEPCNPIPSIILFSRAPLTRLLVTTATLTRFMPTLLAATVSAAPPLSLPCPSMDMHILMRLCVCFQTTSGMTCKKGSVRAARSAWPWPTRSTCTASCRKTKWASTRPWRRSRTA